MPPEGGPSRQAPALTPAWGRWVPPVAQRIGALADGEALTVTAPDELARPTAVKGGMFGRLLGAQHTLVAPWVRLTRTEGLLRAECVKGSERGKGFPMSREDQEFIRSLGWHEAPAETTAYLRFFPDDIPSGTGIDPRDATAAARAVAVLMSTAFALDDPTTLTLS